MGCPLVATTAQCVCSMGAAPSPFVATPDKNVLGEKLPTATIMDNKPTVNIMPFGMCKSLMNPQVAAATSAAAGVLTPVPCVPVTIAPWTMGSSTVLIKKQPALSISSKLMCNWGGMISINNPGTKKIMVPSF